jgi:hypothetical protein
VRSRRYGVERRVDRAEVGDDQAALGLDAVLGGARVAAHDQLAVDEQGVGRAEGEPPTARMRLEHHPGGDDAPAQEVDGPGFVEDDDAGELDRFAVAIALDDEGVSVDDVDDADHGRVDPKDKEDPENTEDEFFHCVLLWCGGEASRAAGRGIGWERKDSTDEGAGGRAQGAEDPPPVVLSCPLRPAPCALNLCQGRV